LTADKEIGKLTRSQGIVKEKLLLKISENSVCC